MYIFLYEQGFLSNIYNVILNFIFHLLWNIPEIFFGKIWQS